MRTIGKTLGLMGIMGMFGLVKSAELSSEQINEANAAYSNLEPEFTPNPENDNFRKKHLGVKKRGYKFKK